MRNSLKKPLKFTTHNTLVLILDLALALSLTTLIVACDKSPTDIDIAKEGYVKGNKSTQKLTKASQQEKPDKTPNLDINPKILADKQEIIINNKVDAATIDPQKVIGAPGINIVRQSFVGLTTTDTDSRTISGVAKSWKTTDNKVWIFNLRNSQWSNGDPVTAKDFVYSFRRLVDPKIESPYASYLVDIRIKNAQKIIDGEVEIESLSVKAINKHTLKITLTDPVPYLPDMLIHAALLPVHQETVEKFGGNWIKPENIVVNGPYKPITWMLGKHIILERNPLYYDNKHTTINKATLLPTTSNVLDMANYHAGKTDVSGRTIPTEQFQSLKKEMGKQLTISPELCTYYYEFNSSKAPFNDVRLRRALSLTFNRKRVVNQILAQGQIPAYQFVPPGTQGNIFHEPQWQYWDMDKRITTARTLLMDAGYNKENPLKFEVLYNSNGNHKKIAIAALTMWKKTLGNVDITLKSQEWRAYLETRKTGNFDVARGAWCADYNEASTFLNILKTNNGANHGKYSSPEFEALLEESLSPNVNAKKRTKIYNQAEAQLDKDAPILAVYHYMSPRLIKPYVIGFPANDSLQRWQIKNMKIAKH